MKSSEADARTRTADPFTTSAEICETETLHIAISSGSNNRVNPP